MIAVLTFSLRSLGPPDQIVHIATSEVTRKQIVRELQIMGDCNSPWIITFYGAYLQDPHIAMCMEFMDKGSLDNVYKKVGPIPEAILAKIALAVVSGLDYLYEVHKIMHRGSFHFSLFTPPATARLTPLLLQTLSPATSCSTRTVRSRFATLACRAS